MSTSIVGEAVLDNRALASTLHYEPEASPRISHRLDDSLFSKDLAPHYMQLATKLANSELVPKCFRGKPQDLFMVWAIGYSIGMSPEQSMQCIVLINGKPCIWGDEMLALCMAHKDFLDIIETPIVKADAVIGYTCIIKRRGREDKENVFTLDMAKKAGLLAKGGVWAQYPERMLKLRARGFCLRDAFPDALKGIKSREEVEDYIDADYIVTQSKGSRTEQFKQDYIARQGENSAGKINGLCAPSTDTTAPIEVIEVNESRQDVVLLSAVAEFHSQIKQLISERNFAGERFTKALAYYEVASIDDLPIESAQHFIQQLLKS